MSSQTLHKIINIIFTPYKKKPQIPKFHWDRYSANQGRTPGDGAGAGAGVGVSCRLLGCSFPPNLDLKSICFVDTMTSKFSRDSPTADFSHLNALMTGTLTFRKIRQKMRKYLMKLKNKNIRRCDLNYVSCRI